MFSFINEVIRSRNLIWQLAKQDLHSKYLGSYLGVFWAFFHPIITILVYWFVFQIGFKSLPINDFPFVLWLIAGLIPWIFLSESISSATSSIVENSFLVKKVVFKVNILPVIKVVSAILVHLFFILLMFVVFAFYGYKPSLYSLQIFYYLFASIVFALSVSWITSSLMVFLKDIGQLVAMLLQLFFWITPIFWNLNVVPESYKILFKLNPMFYIIEGFRETFIYHIWFWEHPYLTLYFWLNILILLFFGMKIFKKLSVHFADVL